MNGQYKRHSAIEAGLNTASGFIISYSSVWIIYPLLGIQTTPAQNFWSVVVFTVISVIRSYCWRRTFNWWQHRQSPEPDKFAPSVLTRELIRHLKAEHVKTSREIGAIGFCTVNFATARIKSFATFEQLSESILYPICIDLIKQLPDKAKFYSPCMGLISGLSSGIEEFDEIAIRWVLHDQIIRFDMRYVISCP